MTNREQFKKNEELVIMEHSIFPGMKDIMNIDETLEWFDYIEENLNTKLTVVDKPMFKIEDKMYTVMDMKVESKEDMINKLNEIEADEIFFYTYNRYKFPKQETMDNLIKSGKISEKYELTEDDYNTSISIRYAYEKEGDIKARVFPTISIKTYNNLPTREKALETPMYDNLIKFNEDEVLEEGKLIKLLKSNPKENGEIELSLELYKLVKSEKR